MQKIFIGLLLVFLDFNLDIGASRIGLIPDFIGYIVLMNGLRELIGKSERFIKARPFAAGMFVYTLVLYIMDLLGVSNQAQAIGYLLGLVSTIISLVVSYNIVMGVNDMEKEYGLRLNADGLFRTWRLLAFFSIAIYLLFLIPVLNIACIIGGFIIGIVFLATFSRTKNLYYEQVTD
ncbi:MAG: hypothetical protein BWY11_01749 [Firmicutes bacterium ADurb.Bin182]|nr:MAG: hypothetical protein BWY11_01749 [Firmicutes bacterium ADurb.Bin182]